MSDVNGEKSAARGGFVETRRHSQDILIAMSRLIRYDS